jgi:phosphoglucosamine mutase
VKNKSLAVNDLDVKKEVEKAKETLSGEGRVLLRESGTEPVVRIMAEAGSEELCRNIIDRIEEVMRERGHIIED